jgi:hypothetical protein
MQEPLKAAGWYLKGGCGNAQHVGHDELLQEELVVHTSRLLESKCEDIARHVVHGSSGAAISIFLEKANMTLSTQQCMTILSKNQQLSYANS